MVPCNKVAERLASKKKDTAQEEVAECRVPFQNAGRALPQAARLVALAAPWLYGTRYLSNPLRPSPVKIYRSLSGPQHGTLGRQGGTLPRSRFIRPIVSVEQPLRATKTGLVR
jgi:hypothetical protein